jgi:hypothetical protein
MGFVTGLLTLIKLIRTKSGFPTATDIGIGLMVTAILGFPTIHGVGQLTTTEFGAITRLTVGCGVLLTTAITNHTRFLGLIMMATSVGTRTTMLGQKVIARETKSDSTTVTG